MRENRNNSQPKPVWLKKLIISAVIFGIVAVAGAGLYGYTWYNTHVKIQDEWMKISEVTELSYDRMLSEEELTELGRCSDHLVKLDMTRAPLSAKEYETIKTAIPGCEIVWKVPFGEMRVDPSMQELTLGKVPPFDWSNLRYMDNVTRVDLTGSGDLESISNLVETYPNCEFIWTANVLGTEYSHDTTTMDLTNESVSSAERLAWTLGCFKQLTSVDLTGCSLSLAEMYEVIKALPNCDINWSYELYGKRFDSKATELDFRKTNVTDLTDLKAALPYLDKVQKVYLTDLDIPSADIEAMADQFTNIKFVWRIFFGTNDRWNMVTDADSFTTYNNEFGMSSPRRLNDEQAQILRYCTDLVALDLGHNALTDISFLANFPKLRILILADNQISDISVLSQLKELEYIELFMNPISDITPLADLPKLRDLNLCSTEITNVDPLIGKDSLKRLWLAHADIKYEDWDEVIAAFPNCKCKFYSDGSTGGGWRESQRYTWMISFFDVYGIERQE